MSASASKGPFTGRKIQWEAVAITAGAIIAAGATIGGALIGRDVINVGIGPGQATPSPAQTVTVTVTPPAATTGSSSQPTASTDSSDAPTVRRTTEGKPPLTLTTGYRADLDTKVSTWDVKYADADARFDLSFNRGSGLNVGSSNDLAIVDGPGSYEVCASSSGYTKEGVDRDEVVPGTGFCVRTSEKRIAFVTIEKATPRDFVEKVQMEVTVWDPPYEE